MRALIVGEGAGALAVVRELGRSGWTVGVASNQRFGLASASRWCTQHHDLPPPTGNLAPFLEAINAAARTEGYEIVFGAGDAEVLAMSANRHEILPLFPYGPDEGVRKGFDKLSLSHLARQFDVASPQTLPASSESLDLSDIPIVVKSRFHWTPGIHNSRTRIPATLATDRAGALRAAEQMRALGAEPLFQAFVPGRRMVLTTLVDKDGSVISAMAQMAMHVAPWEPQRNHRAVTISVDQDLLRRCRNFLNEIRWFGLSCLQFQLAEDGTPVLIDFNGRMVTDSALASMCGMKGHDTWARLALGMAPPRPGTCFVSEGRYYHDMETDLRHILFGSRERRQIPSEIARFLSYSRRAAHPVATRDDLLPVIYYIAEMPSRVVRKAFKGVAYASWPRSHKNIDHP